jgi:hypothetical protein
MPECDLAWTSLPGTDLHGKEGVVGSSPTVGFRHEGYPLAVMTSA